MQLTKTSLLILLLIFVSGTSMGQFLKTANGTGGISSTGTTGIGDGLFQLIGPEGRNLVIASFYPNQNQLRTRMGINYGPSGANGVTEYAIIGSKKAPTIEFNAENGTLSFFGENGTGSDWRTPVHNLGFFINSDGNVGVGTTSTASKLTVEGDMRFTSEYQNLYFATNGVKKGGVGGNSGYNPSLTMFHEGGIEFQTGSPTTDHTKMSMYINGSGDVGIGTRFPTEKLMVDGNIKLNTEWQGIYFGGNNGVSGGMRGNSGHYTSLTMYHGHSLEFQTGSNGIDLNNVRMHINNQGNVGIGTRTPGEKLTVDGNIKLNTEWQHLIFEGNGTYHGGLRGNSGFNTALTMFHGSALEFQTGSNGIDPNNVRMHISTSGDIGIGTRTPTQKLSVAGKINAEEIILEDVAGADFVFEEDYDLPSLEETEQFIKANKHLPEIPSAAEMAEEGLEIKEMNILLLQKVEELTLHLIRQEKEMQAMQQEIQALKSNQ